jgi:hypothetical protein
MEQGITWYDVLGVRPGAEDRKIRHGYDAKVTRRDGQLTVQLGHPPRRGLA